MALKGSDVSIGTQPEEETMQRHWITETTTNSKLKSKGILISKSRDHKQTLWLRMDKFNRLRRTIDDNLVGQEPAPGQNDVWAGRIILGFNWWLWTFATYWINGLKMIVTKEANKITILMGLTIMQASKNFKSNRLLRIFGSSDIILKNLVKHTNN